MMAAAGGCLRLACRLAGCLLGGCMQWRLPARSLTAVEAHAALALRAAGDELQGEARGPLEALLLHTGQQQAAGSARTDCQRRARVDSWA